MDEVEILLKHEQEKILASLSQVLPGSSQETSFNAEDMGKVTNEGKLMDIVMEEEEKSDSVVKRPISRKKRKHDCPFTVSTRKGGRSKKKVEETKVAETSLEENDSGFGTITSSEILKYGTPDYAIARVIQESDSDDSSTSIESVSLLQAATCSAMEVDDISEGVNLAWNVKVFPSLEDDEDEEMQRRTNVDKSVQTVGVPFHSDEKVIRNFNFISSVIRLKQIFSSAASITRKSFERILKRLPDVEGPESPEEFTDESDEVEVAEMDGMTLISERRSRRWKDVVSREKVRFVMRQMDVEDVTEKSVDSILAWLNEETRKDWKTVFYYWDGSVNADAVDLINEAVDSDVIGIRKKVSDFLAGIFNEIHDGCIEDAIMEFKVAFLSNFCQSLLLQYDLILQINEKLAVVVSPGKGNRQGNIATVKKTYFTLRLLENLFRSFLGGLNANGFEEIFLARPKDTDTGVLNMWKKNWMRDEIVIDDLRDFHSKYIKAIRGWSNRMDEILNLSLKECNILSLVAQKCSSLVREILSKIELVEKRI